MSLSKKSLEGNLETLVLALLEKGDSYGYALIEAISTQSKGRICLKEGTLYPLLHRMEKQQWIASFWNQPEGKRRRKYYALTESGQTLLSLKREEWEELKEVFQNLVESGESSSRKVRQAVQVSESATRTEAVQVAVTEDEQLPSWLL